MAQKTVLLGISSWFKNKQNIAPIKKYADGTESNRWAFVDFKNVEYTAKQIKDHLVSGKAICVAGFQDSHRKKSNFISSQIMGIDFDYGPSVDRLVDDTFISRYAFLVYATPSSTEDKPKSRAVFILDQPIIDPTIYQNLIRRLLTRFNALPDESCTDSARIFYGNETEDFWYYGTNILPVEILEALPQHQLEKRSQEVVLGNVDLENPEDVKQLQIYTNNVLQKVYRDLPLSKEGDRHHSIVNAVTKLVGMEISGYPLGNWSEDFKRLASDLLPEGRKDEVNQIMDWAYNNLEPTPLYLPNKVENINVIIEDENGNNSLSDVRTNSDVNSNNDIVRQDNSTVKVVTKAYEFYTELEERYENYEPSWLIESWLMDGAVTIMAAQPQRYKTYLSIDMAWSICSGRYFLEQFPVRKRGNVMIVPLEDSRPNLVKRYASVKNNYFPVSVTEKDNETIIYKPGMPYQPIFVKDGYQFSLDNDQSIAQLEQMIVETKSVLCIIDPIYAATTDAEKYFVNLANQITHKLKPIRARTGVTFLIIAHNKKSQNGGKDLRDVSQIFGSNLTIAAFESKIMLGRDNPEVPNQITIDRHFKDADTLMGLTLEFNVNGGKYDVKVLEGNQKIMVLVGYLSKHGPTKLGVLWDEFGEVFEMKNKSRLLDFLKSHDESFVSHGSGVWGLAADYKES